MFNELSQNFTEFNGMDYALLDKHQGVELGKASNPDPVILNYESYKFKPQNDEHQYIYATHNTH